MLPDKQVSLLAVATSLSVVYAVWTLRKLDSAKGKLLHYSLAISHLRVLVTDLAFLMGCDCLGGNVRSLDPTDRLLLRYVPSRERLLISSWTV